MSELNVISGPPVALREGLAGRVRELRAVDPLAPITVLVGTSLQHRSGNRRQSLAKARRQPINRGHPVPDDEPWPRLTAIVVVGSGTQAQVFHGDDQTGR